MKRHRHVLHRQGTLRSRWATTTCRMQILLSDRLYLLGLLLLSILQPCIIGPTFAVHLDSRHQRRVLSPSTPKSTDNTVLHILRLDADATGDTPRSAECQALRSNTVVQL